MPAAFQPLSQIDPEQLVEYLGREGNSPEIVRWKYFDSRFNRGRERGYAWVKDGKMGGFLGLVPFQLAAPSERIIEAAWTCDWSVQDPTAKGVGILLMRQAQEKYEYLTQLGGNEATQRIVSRLSSMTVNDAGVVFYLPLRLGSVLRVARRRLPKVPVDAIGLLNRIPLRLPKRPEAGSVRFETGVSRIIEPFLEPAEHAELYSRYDFEYVRWQVADCPTLFAETCYPSNASSPRAVALLWREKTSAEFWRVALWAQRGATNDAELVLTSAIRRIYESGGFVMSIIASRLDTSVIELVRAKGFATYPRRRPLHIIVRKKETVPELWPLSYLDTDYAYRF